MKHAQRKALGYGDSAAGGGLTDRLIRPHLARRKGDAPPSSEGEGSGCPPIKMKSFIKRYSLKTRSAFVWKNAFLSAALMSIASSATTSSTSHWNG